MIEGVLDFVIVTLFGAVGVLYLAEMWLLYRAYTVDTTVVALHERLIAAFCRLVVGILLAVLVLNRLFFDALTDDQIGIIGGVATVVLSIPAIRFIRLYVTHGFR